MPNQNDQLKRIDALFDTQRRNSEITVIDNQISPKCTVHRKRRDSVDSNRSNSVTSTYRKNSLYSVHNNYDNNLSKINNSANYRNTDDIKKRNSSVTSIYSSSKDNLNRRKSFTEGFGHSAYDRNRKRNSWNVNMFKSIEHPSAFPSLLRSDALQSTTDINRTGDSSSMYGSVNNNLKTPTRSGTTNLTRRSSMSALSVNKPNKSKSVSITGSTNLNKKNFGGSSLYLRTDSSGNTNLIRRDSIGARSVSSLLSESPSSRHGSTTRDYVSERARSVLSPTPPPTILSTNGKSSILRRSSVDYDHKSDKGDKLTKENLTRHVRILENENTYDGITATCNKSRRQSSNSSNDDLSSFRSRLMSMDSLDWRRSSIDLAENDLSQLTLKSTSKEKTEHEHFHEHERPHFVAVTTLEDTQAVRCAEFHPNGKVYAVGSNSKTFRICEYPSLSQIREDHITYQPTVLFKRTKHHKGSIYCIAWAPDGELVATGSNDKTIKLMRYDDVNKQLEGREMELTMHDGTIRDLCFLEDTSNKASLLISGGAGDCKIYVTDCATATPFQALTGHGGSILSLYNWGGAMFVSGSHDKTVRFWDLRTRGCVNTITPATTPGSRQGSPVAAVCVDPSGRLLVSGHEDSSCVLYDIRGNRPIQCFKFHTSDVRSIRFSPSAYYLLTGGYDNKLALTDLQGDLTLPLPSVFVANHKDKVISGRWHPKDFSFVSTSADKTATLWALPPA